MCFLKKRVLFVAMSRSRDQLYLSTWKRDQICRFILPLLGNGSHNVEKANFQDDKDDDFENFCLQQNNNNQNSKNNKSLVNNTNKRKALQDINSRPFPQKNFPNQVVATKKVLIPPKKVFPSKNSFPPKKFNSFPKKRKTNFLN